MATKPSLSTTTTAVPEISKDMDPKHVAETQLFVKLMSIGVPVPENCNTNGYFDSFLRNFIKVDQIQRGRISCTIVAKPPICNGYGTLHGGAVGSLVEVLTTACARTVVAEDKELFLGEISISYLSGTPINVEAKAKLLGTNNIYPSDLQVKWIFPAE
ncbi:esterase F42H10.6 [Trifolium pratense]|uniref:Esterase F42H10.6 n=1 Tax=Trifolium pratense TaxID=57577 RepID=A0A2K3N366_TRIPR|nr:esterase F42H10.6 [Trifolium pratense]